MSVRQMRTVNQVIRIGARSLEINTLPSKRRFGYYRIQHYGEQQHRFA